MPRRLQTYLLYNRSACITSVSINYHFRIISILEGDAAVFLMLHGAQDMPVVTGYLRPQLPLTGTIRDYLTIHSGKVIRNPSSAGRSSGLKTLLGPSWTTTTLMKVLSRKIHPCYLPEPLQRETFVRYLFSALTDSDWLSTEKHFEKDISEMRVSAALPIYEMMGKLEEEFSRKSKEGKINRMRNEARHQVLQKAVMPCGFYSLALPTGLGKTLTSVAWALRHAKQNDLKRIIIVLPFVNIIDQTAQVLKGILGEEWVLEHHSSYNEDETRARDDEEKYSLIEQRKKLACENWDYPVIVTTTVQFFESLFSNKPSRCRKIHNIAESVVIFDEVQTLPKEVILPTLQMLKNLQSVMRTSFLFCTATQPAFEKRTGFDGIDAICPLIENPGELYKQTRRVKYQLLNDLAPIDSNALLQAAIRQKTATLVIFNTKRAALGFYDRAKDNAVWEKNYHLSTAMCPAHRKEVIDNIRGDLAAGRKTSWLQRS